MNELLLAILDFIEGGDKSKKELLIFAKQLQKSKVAAKQEAKSISEDSQDGIILDFGDKLFEILKQ